MQYLTNLEKQMIDYLSSDVRLLNDLATTKKMAELKKQHDETEERLVVSSLFSKWTLQYCYFLIVVYNYKIANRNK